MHISKWELIKTLRQHIKLSEKRNPAFQQNKSAKIIIYIGGAFVLLYLMFLSVMLALIANSSDTVTPCELMFGLLPFILLVDFGFRFMAQQTPSQQIKPYILLPIGKYSCIDSFLFNSMTSTGNLIWFALFLPYAIMSILFSYGVMASIGFLLALYLLIVCNSLWYMLVRTLVNKSYWWWLLPAVVYAIIFSPWYLGKNASIENLFDTYAVIGEEVSHWSILAFGGILLLMAILVYVNRKVQYNSVYAELSRSEQTKLHHVSELKSLDRYGEVGEYIKLEIKSIMRNKNIKKGFWSANILVLVFSLLMSFTDVYQGAMTIFLSVYNFAIYGAMILVRVMCYEGNYIDCLMVRKENIISLLKAKYYFYSLLLIVPFLLMLPTLITGKCSLLMLLTIIALIAGPIHIIFLHMAIYNKQTVPLNTKFIGRGGMETNYVQVVVNMAALFLPPLLVGLLPLLLGETTAYIVILCVGLFFIATSKYWIRSIYNKMMRRRYVNLEGFRATR